MDTTKIRTVVFVTAIFFCVVAAPVEADWNVGGSHKMHYPQLPDLNGLDVANCKYNASNPLAPLFEEQLLLADDWLCTETGPVTDIHIWGSWQHDIKGEIESFNVSIWSNDPGTNFSHPGDQLWQHTFSGSEITERYWGNGSQGWWEISSDSQNWSWTLYGGIDHNDTWQYNLHINPAIAFEQKEGNTYWLALSPHVNNSRYHFGWKTSWNASQDKIVFQTLFEESDPHREGMWFSNIYFPEAVQRANESLAFVIDGPPLEVSALTPIGLIALVSLLSAIAAVAIVRKRR